MLGDESGEGLAGGDGFDGDGEFDGAGGLDWFDEMLVELKSNGLSDTATAMRLACSTKTVQRHKQRPEVRAALVARQAERVSQVRAMLGEAAVAAVAVLFDGLRAPMPSDRQRAAQLIVNAFLRLRGDDGNVAAIEELRDELAELRELRASQERPA